MEQLLAERISYSVIYDALICFCCKLFSNNYDIPLELNGYSNLKNVQRALSVHEKSNEHRICYMKYANLKDKLKQKLTGVKKCYIMISKMNRAGGKKFSRFLDCILFLARRNLAFRGSSDQIGNENNGNFVGLVELLGKDGPLIADHIDQARRHKHIHY